MKMAHFWFLWLTSLFCTVSAILRVMPLGDSITAGGCWRATLYQNLQAAGLTKDVKFVGSQKSLFRCQGTYDSSHEGHVGYEAIGIARQNQLPAWLEKSKPVDVVLMLLGTNDVWRGRSTSDAMNAFSKLLDQMRTSSPNVKLLVAKIPPLKPSGSNCGSNCAERVVEFNKAVAKWGIAKSTTTSPIVVVDCYSGVDLKADTNDGIHPNSGSGTKKMANCWLGPLTNVIKAGK